ncbi:glycosyltransferase family 4 protein [Enterovibrio nigricans]|uniref:Glycosyltransferase involved in cell wall bisynthesis n=1 Tax=Enterovibrio nigricans DSM 22720 TaxID=1121868 RepID=A0A1T4U7X9_9GAMM|nr:glycosyltransferase family 4 protein [Enterovibrio nigricans]SKA48783.1 Glycosyltransferase involved in cell wall bisynthesis [Enterovibrio nigricans DSM 22720]
MRIAIFPDEYLPESTRVHAKMLHELAKELISQGNDVVIVTPGVEQQTRLSVCFYEGVEIWRFRSGLLRGKGKLHRAINESLLSIKCWLAIKKQLDTKPIDICVNYSPTIFFGPLMYLIKKKCRSNVFLVLRDLFPKWVIDEGLIHRKSPIAYYFRMFEHLNYRVSDTIGLMSETNLKQFGSLYPRYKNTTVLPNWSDCRVSVQDYSDFNIREKLSLEDKTIFFYGGNIGHAQGITTLLDLADSMKDIDNCHFLFIGQGDEVEKLKYILKKNKLDNITYMPAINQIDYLKILSQVDVGLVSLAKSHTSNNHPGKILGYMNYSLPILGVLNAGNDLIDIINKEEAGFVFSTDAKVEDIKSSAVKLLGSKDMMRKMGVNGNRLLKSNYSCKNASELIINSTSNRL